MLYLITTMRKQEVPDSTGLPPGRIYGMTNVKELADWCHAFMRALAASGWRKEKGILATEENIDISCERTSQFLNDFKSHGLEPWMQLGREGTADKILIKIKLLEVQSAANAAALFTR